METEAAQIMEDAVTEAVNEAVKPYKLVVEKMERQVFWWKVGAGTAGAVALAAIIWAAVK